MFLKLYQLYQAYKRRRQLQSRILRLFRILKRQYARNVTRAEGLFVTSRSGVLLTSLALLALPFVVMALAAAVVSSFIYCDVAEAPRPTKPDSPVPAYSKVVVRVTTKPQASSTTVRLYRLMEEAEARLLLKHINSRKDVSAWYTPTAFWPHFNRFKRPPDLRA